MKTNQDTEQLYRENVLGNYGLPPITFVRGRGSRLWDDKGKEYLDFCAGIAVVNMGHSHPTIVKAIQEQAAELVHVSNLYRNEKQALLAAKLNEKAGGGGKLMFCNSGAEANEALIKLSRLYGKAKSGVEGQCYKVVVAENAFHGRTFGGMSATPQEKIQGGFRPLVSGFVAARLNDIDSFRRAIDDQTAAVFIETIQGEGGIHVAEVEFLQELRTLCDEKGVLLLIDEVQCGVGRTGKFFAFEHAGIRPDAIGMAKALGNGSPIGAVWIDDQYAGLFKPGSHGTTFGGTPLICASALATLQAMEEASILEKVESDSIHLFQKLDQLKSEFPEYILEIRGKGFMVGIQIAEPPLELVTLLRAKGLIVLPAGGNVVRLLPPLIATSAEIDEAISLLGKGMAERAAELQAGVEA